MRLRQHVFKDFCIIPQLTMLIYPRMNGKPEISSTFQLSNFPTNN